MVSKALGGLAALALSATMLAGDDLSGIKPPRFVKGQYVEPLHIKLGVEPWFTEISPSEHARFIYSGLRIVGACKLQGDLLAQSCYTLLSELKAYADACPTAAVGIIDLDKYPDSRIVMGDLRSSRLTGLFLDGQRFNYYYLPIPEVFGMAYCQNWPNGF